MNARARLIEPGATPAQTREIPINDPEFLIGRGSDCNLRLRAEEVSRHHCMIRLAGEGAVLVDLGSSNGTFLNGERVRSQTPVRTGDRIQVGPASFLIDLGDPEAANLEVLDGDPHARTLKLPKK
jgi:pSer/pThr/pTyr-binding forkhead associated (FHA) protein